MLWNGRLRMARRLPMNAAQEERDQLAARAYANDTAAFHDSDGVPVEDVFLAGVLAERARWKDCEEALERIANGGIDRTAVDPFTQVELGVWSIPAGWSPSEHARGALSRMRGGVG